MDHVGADFILTSESPVENDQSSSKCVALSGHIVLRLRMRLNCKRWLVALCEHGACLPDAIPRIGSQLSGILAFLSANTLAECSY